MECKRFIVENNLDRRISQLICFISHLYTLLDIISTHLIAHTLFVKENEFTYFV